MQVFVKPYRLGDLIYTSELSWVYEANFALASREAKKIPLILKTLPRSRHEEGKIQALKKRVQSEAQALKSLDNPFIVKVIDDGDAAGFPYLVMRRRSLNLSEYLQAKGKISLVAAIPLLYNLATALDYAHRQGLIHRDIKPDNILLDLDASGQALYPYLTDFGIAQFQERGFHTETNQLMGTMAYMPPERWEGKETSRLSDIYSFGLVAYEMLTGTPLFQAGEAVQVHINRVLNPNAAFLDTVKAKLDPDVAVHILKAIARNPADRYQTATEFADNLGKLLSASNLDVVNQMIARNVAQAGLADIAALQFKEAKRKPVPVFWLTVAALSFFLIGVLWATFKPRTPVISARAEVTQTASLEVAIVPSLTASLSPEPSLTATSSPTSSPTTTVTETPSPSSTPSLTPSLTLSPTITATMTITSTPEPEVNCEGAAWIYHVVQRDDSLSHYAASLINAPAFAGLDYSERQAYIVRVNAALDFRHLAVGDLVCLPAAPPRYIAAPTATELFVGGSVEATNASSASSGTNNGASSGGGNSGGSSSGGGNGSGGGNPAPTNVPAPTDVPAPTINVAVSSSCGNGNSGSTTFTVRNNGTNAVNISWRVNEGGNQIASGSLSLNAGASATAWSGNTKNKSYSLTVTDTGASSGENCG